jgi:hypothetical protein
MQWCTFERPKASAARDVNAALAGIAATLGLLEERLDRINFSR